MDASARSLTKSIKMTKEVKNFCRRFGITRYVPVVFHLVEESFLCVARPEIYPECDPETGEEWLVIRVTVKGPLEEVLDQYREYTKKKVEKVPFPHRDAIRLMHFYRSE